LKETKVDCLDVPSIDLPEGWSCVKTEGLGPFVTRAILRHPKGFQVIWDSRGHRKHHNLLDNENKSTWWAPAAIGWWIGILFAIGSICFAAGAAPGYVDWVGNHIDGMTFFIGSIFFTIAAFLQYIETVNTRRAPKGCLFSEKKRFFTWEPRRIDWVASIVQFIGTLFFNISTFYALNSTLTVQQINQHIWVPDVYGSICFLIASGLAWIEVGHSLFSWKIRNLSWQIAFLNLLGSIAFGLSAITAFVLPLTGQPISLTLVNLGTFTGAICFLIGAILLLPERTHPN
jgi:hypothetical protein